MKIVLAFACSAALLAGVASAQTAGDVMDTEGLAGFTNIQQAIGKELIRAGVPETCLEQLPMGAVGQISALAASGDDPDVRRQVKTILERECGSLN
ncbi:MAG: hypothetical protein AAGB10_11915 [Pseudomonadota bacterium]